MCAQRSTRRATRLGRLAAAGLAALLGGTALPAPTSAAPTSAAPTSAALNSAAPTTTPVSANRAGRLGNGPSSTAAVSATGRYVTFLSAATNLVPGDANGLPDLFLRDRLTGAVELVNVSSTGIQANGGSWPPARISPDGRYVTFSSLATNLVPGANDGRSHVYLRDRKSRTTRRVSVTSDGALGDDHSYGAAVSANGRYVAFSSHASDLVGGDTNGRRDVFLRDVRFGTTRRVSVADGGRVQGDQDSGFPVLSDDGRYVGFLSTAGNLSATPPSGGTNNAYVKDVRTGALELVSVSATGERFYTGTAEMSMSADGRFVGFSASDLIPYVDGAYVRDRARRTTVLASVAVDGAVATGRGVSISPDGRYVAFLSDARNIVPGTPHLTNVFIRDLRAGTTTAAGPTRSGTYVVGHQAAPAASNTGVAFGAYAADVDPGPRSPHPDQVHFRQF